MIFSNSSTLLALAISSLLAFNQGEACVVPTGINDGGIDFSDLQFPLPPGGIFGGLIQAALPYISRYETPILMRNTLGVVIGIYGAGSAFEDDALEFLGRMDVSEARRRCAGSNLFNEHRAVTLAYSNVWHAMEFAPASTNDVIAEATKWNLDLNICDNQDCSDITTPWGLAKSILEDTKGIFAVDGWNADGSLSSTFNRVPFSDWRSNPYEPNLNNKKSWKPLQETDGLGFVFNQQHVTPHIGETARSYFLGDEDVCSRKLDNPKYKYAAEAELVLGRTAALDDITKAQVEFFDSKLTSVVPFQAQYYIRSGVILDSWEFIVSDTVAIATIYESIIVSWKEKVRHDAIRPTTWIHENLKDEIVISYQGPSEGMTGPIPASEWQPYIRVMPHAEYPSGSSCLCTAFANAQIAWTGIDDFTSVIGGPLVATVPAGSSKYEQNQPSQDINLTYSSWTEMAQKCGESRLDGGMHFTDAVPDGEEVCGSIGLTVVDYFRDLVAGFTPLNAVPIEEALTVPNESRNC
mmetsp:Transcript_1965/g.3054  ORF Transcript_1965/g.3054 Transcript_1965/m.3054 type:complete len:522 (+) Transcript_1965:66-1631(+)